MRSGTGPKVDLDVDPLIGSLENHRSLVRSAKGWYNLVVMNSGWFAEIYFDRAATPITDVDPSFKLDPHVFTPADTCWLDRWRGR